MEPERTCSLGLLTAALFLLSLLGPGASALKCYSCVQKADDGCSSEKMKVVTCPPGQGVCTETVGAVETIHGQFSLAIRGCGSGLSGKNDRGLDLHGLLAFLQLQQCDKDLCNAQLNLTSHPLNPNGNESAHQPNGVQCYSCVGLSREACTGTKPPLAQCYNAGDQIHKGCFDGNVTLTAANVTVSLPVRGCVQDDECTKDGVTGPGFSLSGSCCSGTRCNSDLRNKTFFAPGIPPLVVLPVPRPTATSRPNSTVTKTPASTRVSTPSPSSSPAPSTTLQAPARESTSHSETSVETSREEGAVNGGAIGHSDRSNVGQLPPKGGSQHPGNTGARALGFPLVLFLVAILATTLL
ncbi:ly6/PLAUR domain-containing protein 3 [Monodelphis domestica]|uniref:ly6/PLAUR domain-containing protein 3 n=1 Tax=Monodelphis domestica TaxID=13616 RepID=UPI0024E22E57|nr:ly6/PLAUR domain-containing protein 3 [Monodelphis domestica]